MPMESHFAKINLMLAKASHLLCIIIIIIIIVSPIVYIIIIIVYCRPACLLLKNRGDLFSGVHVV